MKMKMKMRMKRGAQVDAAGAVSQNGHCEMEAMMGEQRQGSGWGAR